MHNQNLGIVPAIPIIVKAIPAVLSFLGGKKAKKKAAQAAQYQASEQAIAEGRAVSALDVFTDRDKQMLRSVWPQTHVAANWTDINWGAIGMPQGPQLSPAGEIAIREVWPQVHVAARFDDVNWTYHSIPIEKVATALPLPELGYQTPAAPPQGYLPELPQGYAPQGPQVIQRGAPLTASMFPGVTRDAVITAAVIGAVALLLFGDRR